MYDASCPIANLVFVPDSPIANTSLPNALIICKGACGSLVPIPTFAPPLAIATASVAVLSINGMLALLATFLALIAT